MTENKIQKMHFRLYEYVIYWLVTAVLLILAVPLLIFKFCRYLVVSTGAPLKSASHLVGFVLVLIIIAAGFVTYKIFIPYPIGPEVKSITVQDKERFSQVIGDLKEAGILHDVSLFRRLTVMSGLDRSVAPGRYDFSGRVSLYSIISKFRNRNIATIDLTVPEGLPVYKTASILAGALGIDSAAFYHRVFDSVYTAGRYGLNGLEGYLFPETYRFWYGIKIDQIIDIMVEEFYRHTDSILAPPFPNNLSAEKIVTLASIVEAEATDPDEMGRVASVYHNRLRDRMMLQADPTVIYALGGLDRPLNRRDIRVTDSPYNTYKHYGLPPGPINSPGRQAITAAVRPDSSGYYYFVADGTGRHIFSRTLREHNRARERVKRARL